MSYQNKTTGTSKFSGTKVIGNNAGPGSTKERKPTTHYMVAAVDVPQGEQLPFVNNAFLTEITTKDGRVNLQLSIAEGGIPAGLYFINKKKSAQ